jgi:hypothetical protein
VWFCPRNGTASSQEVRKAEGKRPLERLNSAGSNSSHSSRTSLSSRTVKAELPSPSVEKVTCSFLGFVFVYLLLYFKEILK